MIAASLKPTSVRSAIASTATFPRSIDRGLIEATIMRATVRGNAANFRDQLIAASLKRSLAHRAEQSDDRHFRDQLIAASLKHGQLRHELPVDCHFRDQLIAASLKP